MKSRARCRRAAAAASATVLLLGLAACAPESAQPGGSGGDGVEPSVTTPSVTQPDGKGADEGSLTLAIIPECSGLITDAQARSALHPDYVAWDGFDDPLWAKQFLGPAALAAYGGAKAITQCDWGVPNSNHLTHVFVATLSTEARERFVGSLRDSDFTETSLDGTAIFSYVSAKDDGWKQRSWYGIVGNVWVGAFHTRGVEAIEVVVSNLRELNPEWTPGTV